jgi:uncharacterized OsmC-like protein
VKNCNTCVAHVHELWLSDGYNRLWKGSYVWRMILDLRSVQRPLKKKYRDEPGSSRITLEAKASQEDTPISCSVDVGQAIYEAEAHAGVGGTGEVACSGDLLLGALAACAQVTCQMVAEAMGIEAEKIEVTVEGDMDLAGTLGISQDIPVGFETIRTTFDIVAPEATEEQLENLRHKTEQYCVVYQTLAGQPELQTEWA